MRDTKMMVNHIKNPINKEIEEDEEDIVTKEKEFNGGWPRKKATPKTNMTGEGAAFTVEEIIAILEVAAEEDAILNMHGKPSINKLKKLPLLVDALTKKDLQNVFISHGILTTLRNWLEPLPDGSLPHVHIRETILCALKNQFRIDLNRFQGRDQLKKSGLGKAIMFLSRVNEETESNRKFAKDLVYEWSRGIFNKSTNYKDLRDEIHDERPCTYNTPPLKKQRKSTQVVHSTDVLNPEKTSMNFYVRPRSKFDKDTIRMNSMKIKQDERCSKFVEKLKQVNKGKILKRKSLQGPQF